MTRGKPASSPADRRTEVYAQMYAAALQGLLVTVPDPVGSEFLRVLERARDLANGATQYVEAYRAAHREGQPAGAVSGEGKP